MYQSNNYQTILIYIALNFCSVMKFRASEHSLWSSIEFVKFCLFLYLKNHFYVKWKWLKYGVVIWSDCLIYWKWPLKIWHSLGIITPEGEEGGQQLCYEPLRKLGEGRGISEMPLRNADKIFYMANFTRNLPIGNNFSLYYLTSKTLLFRRKLF